MLLLVKVLLTMLIIGFVGTYYNMVRAKDPEDWRNHLYSTAMLGIPILSGIVFIVYLIWND